jgi:hypothetical protein
MVDEIEKIMVGFCLLNRLGEKFAHKQQDGTLINIKRYVFVRILYAGFSKIAEFTM